MSKTYPLNPTKLGFVRVYLTFLFLMQNMHCGYITGFDAESVTIDKFLQYDIKGKVIIAFSFTTLDDDEFVKFYKVTPRAQVGKIKTIELLK